MSSVGRVIEGPSAKGHSTTKDVFVVVVKGLFYINCSKGTRTAPNQWVKDFHLRNVFQPIFVNFCCCSVKNSLDKNLFSVFLTKISCNITGSKSLNREVEYFL